MMSKYYYSQNSIAILKFKFLSHFCFDFENIGAYQIENFL